jgi:uncharacterized membrane-anchored protein
MDAIPSSNAIPPLRTVFSKVPEVTLFFWTIKILCTTVGETAADFLNVNLNLGLTLTSIIMGVLLVIALVAQFKTKKYTPVIYWLAVMLISVFGTLVTDNLTDSIGVPLEYSTIAFTVLLAGTFGIWYATERTLSIHSIFTRKREMFYWLAILFTFALGTAAGDLMAEGLGFGYATTGIIIAALITVFAIAWRLGLNAILSFWFIYILTRPLGASIGDFLTQTPEHGGIGFGPTLTTILFVAGIVAMVLYLALTRRDIVKNPVIEEDNDMKGNTNGTLQLGIVSVLLLVAAVTGYNIRHHQLQTQISPSAGILNDNKNASSTAPLGDLSNFQKITQDTLDLVNAGSLPEATTRVADLEYAWDTSEARLKPMDKKAWNTIDDAIDSTLRELRAVHPDQQASRAALQTLLDTLNNPTL